MHSSRSSGDESLVPFIHAGDKSRHQPRNPGPSQGPWPPSKLRQHRPPRPEQQKAHGEVANKVARLADIEIPNREVLASYAKQIMTDGIKKTPGITRRKPCSGFHGNHAHPDERWNPGLDYFVAARGHLFDRIVGRFARDHDVVHMALAKTRTADAHKSCLL